MSRPKNQDPISLQDLQKYLTYVLTNQVENTKHAKELRRLSRRTTTLSDVTVLVKTMNRQQEQRILQLMDTVQIQHRVLERMGATEEMFDEARTEYETDIKELQEQLGSQLETEEEANSEEEATKDGKEE